GGLFAAQDAVDIGRRLAKLVDPIDPVGHEATGRDVIAARMDRWQAMPGSERDDEIAMRSVRKERQQDQAAVRHAREGFDGALDVSGSVDLNWHWLDRQRRREGLGRPHEVLEVA